MAPPPRFWALLASALLVFAGLALGAASQKEVFLETNLETQAQEGNSGASGNLVALTAVLVGLGAAGATASLSTAPWRRTLTGAAVVAPTVLMLTLLVQSAYPNSMGFQNASERIADLTINPLLHDSPGLPSVLVPIMGLLVGGLLVLGWAGRWLSGRTDQDPSTPGAALRSLVFTTALATPFLAVTAAGSIRFLVGERLDAASTTPYLVVLPAVTLASLGLIVVQAMKAWHLGAVADDPRLAPVARDAWTGLGRAEWILTSLLLATAAASSFLAKAPFDVLETGLTFGVTIRGHTQLLLFVLPAMLPGLLLHRKVLACLPDETGSIPSLHDPAGSALRILLLVMTGLVVAGAMGGAWLGTEVGILWGWILPFLPAAALAWIAAPRRAATLPVLLLAILVWGLGNSVVAHFDARGDATLRFDTLPGVLALWRLTAAGVAATAFTRLLLTGAQGPRALRWPLAVGGAGGFAGALLMELPLSAWLVTSIDGEAIGYGSVVSGQSATVQAVMHASAALGILFAAFAYARLHRPTWFQRPPPDVLAAPDRDLLAPA